MTILEICNYLETLAPVSYQESYDNSGFQCGDPHRPVSGVLVSLDCTQEVVQEAINKNCNLIITHHPLVFKPLKRITGQDFVQKILLKAIKNDITLYAIHTNLDHIATGVNAEIARRLGLQHFKVLEPKAELLAKLVAFCPRESTNQVLEALYEAGAGKIGNYKHCSFRTEGIGSFQPNEFANPYIGKQGMNEEAIEERIEVMFPAFLQEKIVDALLAVHPYEEVAYYLQSLLNKNQEVGAGGIGLLPVPMPADEFVKHLKTQMNLSWVRHTALPDTPVHRVAFCGGSGFFLLKVAIREQADVFITSDVKYHDFFEADKKIVLMDIGHYESEAFTKDLIARTLSKKFTNIAVLISELSTNPVYYS